MILVVADIADVQAQWLVSHWAEHDARLLLPFDLSRQGWTFRPCSSHPWSGVASGRAFDSNTTITGIINLLGQITEEQLPHIDPEDRSYVASEMTAFLLSWQTELTCPILNRPQPNCLMGPSMSIEEWLLVAARLGQPVGTITTDSRRRSAAGRQPYRNAAIVTVVGEQALGGDPELQARALSIARSAGVELAALCFSSRASRAFLGASLRPELANPEVATALLEYFQGAPATRTAPYILQSSSPQWEARPC